MVIGPSTATSRARVVRERASACSEMSCVLIPPPQVGTTQSRALGVVRGLRGQGRRPALEGEAEELSRGGRGRRGVRDARRRAVATPDPIGAGPGVLGVALVLAQPGGD